MWGVLLVVFITVVSGFEFCSPLLPSGPQIPVVVVASSNSTPATTSSSLAVALPSFHTLLYSPSWLPSSSTESCVFLESAGHWNCSTLFNDTQLLAAATVDLCGDSEAEELVLITARRVANNDDPPFFLHAADLLLYTKGVSKQLISTPIQHKQSMGRTLIPLPFASRSKRGLLVFTLGDDEVDPTYQWIHLDSASTTLPSLEPHWIMANEVSLNVGSGPVSIAAWIPGTDHNLWRVAVVSVNEGGPSTQKVSIMKVKVIGTSGDVSLVLDSTLKPGPVMTGPGGGVADTMWCDVNHDGELDLVTTAVGTTSTIITFYPAPFTADPRSFTLPPNTTVSMTCTHGMAVNNQLDAVFCASSIGCFILNCSHQTTTTNNKCLMERLGTNAFGVTPLWMDANGDGKEVLINIGTDQTSGKVVGNVMSNGLCTTCECSTQPDSITGSSFTSYGCDATSCSCSTGTVPLTDAPGCLIVDTLKGKEWCTQSVEQHRPSKQKWCADEDSAFQCSERGVFSAKQCPVLCDEGNCVQCDYRKWSPTCSRNGSCVDHAVPIGQGMCLPVDLDPGIHRVFCGWLLQQSSSSSPHDYYWSYGSDSYFLCGQDKVQVNACPLSVTSQFTLLDGASAPCKHSASSSSSGHATKADKGLSSGQIASIVVLCLLAVVVLAVLAAGVFFVLRQMAGPKQYNQLPLLDNVSINGDDPAGLQHSLLGLDCVSEVHFDSPMNTGERVTEEFDIIGIATTPVDFLFVLPPEDPAKYRLQATLDGMPVSGRANTVDPNSRVHVELTLLLHCTTTVSLDIKLIVLERGYTTIKVQASSEKQLPTFVNVPQSAHMLSPPKIEFDPPHPNADNLHAL